jgi:hypothetical protein
VLLSLLPAPPQAGPVFFCFYLHEQIAAVYMQPKTLLLLLFTHCMGRTGKADCTRADA